MINVVIADDHELVRAGIRMLVDSFQGMQVIGEASDGIEALALIEKARPQVAIMDVSMPGMGGMEALKRVVSEAPRTRVLVLSMHDEEAYVHRALQSGAAGYILKEARGPELEMALRTVAAGGTYLSGPISKSVLASLARDAPAEAPETPLDALTARQLEILRLVASGCTTKEVAARLGLSSKTVEAHRGRIMERLGLRDLAGLVRFAVRAGLVSGER